VSIDYIAIPGHYLILRVVHPRRQLMVKRPQSVPKKRGHDLRRGPVIRLRVAHTPRLSRYVEYMTKQTHFLQVILLLVVLWLLFSVGLFLAERGADGTSINTFGQALYWGVTTLSTVGSADTPTSGLAQAIGGAWMIIGPIVFFGTITASITGYFMRPVQRPVRQIIDTIEYNLEHLDDLSIEELELLKKTTDGLIVHTERLRRRERSEPK
jgi:voltage-gated potassium channel